MDAKRREELRQWIGAGRSEGTSHRYLNDLELLQLLDDSERVEQALDEYDNGSKPNEDVGAAMVGILRRLP